MKMESNGLGLANYMAKASAWQPIGQSARTSLPKTVNANKKKKSKRKKTKASRRANR